MTRNEQNNWQINIETLAARAAKVHNPSLVRFIFKKYDADGFHDLSPCYFSEVFSELEMLNNDN